MEAVQLISPTAIARGQDAERARILAALSDLVTEHGYESTSLAMVFERARVDEQTFHRHFPNLEDCFYEIIAVLDRDLVSRADAAFESERGWRNQLRATVHAMFDFVAEDPRRAHLLFVRTLSLGGRFQLMRDQAMSFFTDLLDRGRYELDDPSSVSRATAEGIAGAVYFRIYTAIAQSDTDSVDGLSELFPQLMYTAMLPYVGTSAALEEMQRPWSEPKLPRSPVQ